MADSEPRPTFLQQGFRQTCCSRRHYVTDGTAHQAGHAGEGRQQDPFFPHFKKNRVAHLHGKARVLHRRRDGLCAFRRGTVQLAERKRCRGSEKHRVTALIQRLYDPDRGHVLIDEQDVTEVTQDSLRRSIAVVHQDVSLFHRSVLHNLRYGKPDASDSEIFRAAELARCTEFIECLPQGFETIVGERGLKLSGGERQRLAIARAFLCDAPIVLLDEATSALDTESEQAIQAALTRLFKGRTVIAIAHRLSTVNAFDRIVVLDKGRIIEQGPPGELLRHEGAYSRMYVRQLSARRA